MASVSTASFEFHLFLRNIPFIFYCAVYSWAQYLCSLTYSVRIGLVEEFYGTCGPSQDAVKACDSLVNNLGANPDDTWWYWLVLACIFAVFRLLAVIVLRRKATKFL